MLAVAEVKGRGQRQLQTEIVTVTPELAKHWLDKNERNRTHSNASIKRYARDMKTGKWQISGEAIKFDRTNKLLDGQHRLLACIQAETPFDTLVIYGLPPEVQDVMDSGKLRSARDVLTIHGLNNAANIASACRILLSERDGMSAPFGSTYSTPQVLEALEDHKRITRYVVAPKTFPQGISISQVAYIAYVGGEVLKRPDRAQAFIDVLKTGVPDYEDDIVHMYRERIIRDQIDDMKIGRISRWWTLKYCWNLFVDKQRSMLHFRKKNVAIEGLDPSVL